MTIKEKKNNNPGKAVIQHTKLKIKGKVSRPDSPKCSSFQSSPISN